MDVMFFLLWVMKMFQNYIGAMMVQFCKYTFEKSFNCTLKMDEFHAMQFHTSRKLFLKYNWP